MKPLLVRTQSTSLLGINVEIIENHYGGKFIGDFCIRTKNGGWSATPVAIFYQPNPNRELGHTNYFGIFIDQNNTPLITAGDSAFSDGIVAKIANDGEIIYSRYVHDHVTSNDGSTWIDGGRSYTRTDTNGQLTRLIIQDDKLVIDPTYPQ